MTAGQWDVMTSWERNQMNALNKLLRFALNLISTNTTKWLNLHSQNYSIFALLLIPSYRIAATCLDAHKIRSMWSKLKCEVAYIP